jgi:Phospholipid methyltransferase
VITDNKRDKGKRYIVKEMTPGPLPQLIEATGGIPVDEIVLRTKCELSEAFRDVPSAEDTDEVIKTSKYAWLQNWTAQANLTLQIVDQATLSPGASITQPLHNGYPTNAGPTSIASSGVTTITTLPQSFAVAGGVNLNGQAMRTETMSFVFSVKELGDWRRLPETNRRCALSDNMDLGGRLGLTNVRVEEGQKVISTGVYGFVRHPMYFAALFLFIGTPLALGSWWTLLLFPVFIPILVARILNEEKVLVRNLPGYIEYTHKVRYRLIPGVW